MRLVTLILIGTLQLAALPGRAQVNHPPQVPLWAEEPNGDAIQKDLGFILPAKWQNFARIDFSSTRPDGGSVKVGYVSEDKAIHLAILIQLRTDIRGVDMGPDFSWRLLKLSGDFEYAARNAKPTELSTEPFSLGNRYPAGKVRWVRYDLQSGPEVQGLWWQDIGLWSVVITMSGPEVRRADIEAAAKTLIEEMPFPSAPITTELAIVGKKLFAGMRKCDAPRPEAAGVEVLPSFKEAASLAIVMPGLVLGRANDSLISPVTRGQEYCRIETFDARKDLPVIAIQYVGPATAVWEARYGFVINNGVGGYYQVERIVDPALGALTGEENAPHAYLNFSNNKRASLFTVFDGWPSYEEAKKAVAALHADPENRPSPILTMTHPAKGVEVVTNQDRIQRVAQ